MISYSHLVGPLSHSYAAAGFFPRATEPEILEALDEADGFMSIPDEDRVEQQQQPQISDQESVYNQSKYWLIEDSATGPNRLNKQFRRCTQTSNLRSNFLYWDAKSKEAKQAVTQ